MKALFRIASLVYSGALVASLGCGEADEPGGLGATHGSGGVGGEPGGSEAGGSGGSAATVQPGCLNGQALCGSACVDLASNVGHCGACGQACAAGASCVGGQCVCQDGLADCGGSCVNLLSDGTSCGECGNLCPPGEVCSSGICQGTCAVGQELCGTSCADLATDPTNCGACGVACSGGQICVGGGCSCPAGLTLCGDACTDVLTDSNNCRDCGMVCAAGQTCVAGSCLGGDPGSGGASGSGGTAEPSTGSSATGGVTDPATGGSATGGESDPATGGSATGGESDPATGGSATGGVSDPATGGSATGGVTDPATGGSATGGESDPATGGSAGASVGCEGGDYYVATDGNDSNPGTIGQPFATLQRAIDAAEPGDLVYVRGGTYEIVQKATGSAGVHFNKSGTSDANRIRYFACPGEVPAFDFANLEIRSDPYYTYGFLVEGAWLHLRGFEVRNMPMNTRSNIGVRVSGNAHHDIFELMDLHHNNGSGMFISHTTGGHQIINCDSHDNYDPDSHQGDGQNADGFGVHYQESGDVTVFRGCRAWWNSDDGWDFISQEVPVLVENSWAYGNGYTNSGQSRPGDGNGAGFKVGSSKTGIRHTVTTCVAWGNRSQGFYANHSSGGNDWFNNTSFDNGTQFNMLASTWNSSGDRTDGVILTGDKVHRMRNNISFPLDNTNMEGVDDEFNSWNLGLTPSNGDFVTVDDSGALGPRQPDGSLPDIDFMKLSDGSQMVDKGTDVGLPFTGSSPDLGARER